MVSCDILYQLWLEVQDPSFLRDLLPPTFLPNPPIRTPPLFEDTTVPPSSDVTDLLTLLFFFFFACFGFLINDPLGNTILVGCNRYSLNKSVRDSSLLAECHAILDGLKAPHQHQITHLKVYTDSQSLVNMLSKQSSVPWQPYQIYIYIYIWKGDPPPIDRKSVV